MHVIEAYDADDALAKGLSLLSQVGVRRETRCGPALVSPDPVTTKYVYPRRRVLFSPRRDANPFFHLFEALWMLDGRDDVESIARYNGRLAQFSDDGETFHGAYGRRWRRWLERGEAPTGIDQLADVAAELRANPGCRRQVLQMWDPDLDLTYCGKDAPCNLCAHVQRDQAGRLDLTVFCRSNDVVWGAYGSDLVTFSILQEYLAAAIGCPVGRYWQVSDNWHGYESTAVPLMKDIGVGRRYPYPSRYPYPKVFPLASTNPDDWRLDLGRWWNREETRDPFFDRVAEPMRQAWRAYKLGGVARVDQALGHLEHDRDVDWILAAREWLERRRR